MARITVEDCIDKFPSRFELVLVASQRARTLHSGDESTLEKNNDKNTVIALREIADSVLTTDQMKENLVQEYQTITINDEEEENLEMESEHTKENLADPINQETLIKDEIDNEIEKLTSSEDKELEKQYNSSEDSSDEINNEMNSSNTESDNSNIESDNSNTESDNSNTEIDNSNTEIDNSNTEIDNSNTESENFSTEVEDNQSENKDYIQSETENNI